MKLFNTFCLSLIVLVAVACGSKSNDSGDKNKDSIGVSTTAPLTVNPAHGLPGHRCDLAVGAPLNGTAAPVNSIPAPTPQPTMTQPAQTVQQPAAGSGTGNLNPAHGQPGHRCDIAVGAPL